MHKTVFILAGLAVNAAAIVPVHAEPLVTRAVSTPVCASESALVATEQVLVSPARKETRTIPAQYRTVERQEVATPARVNKYRTPAVVSYVHDVEVVEPQKVVRRHIPVSHPVLTGHVATYYDVGPGYFTPAPTTTAGVYYGAYPTAVVTGYTVDEVIPPVVRNVQRQVIVRPEQTVEEMIPATYRTVQVREEVSPARTEVVHVPAVYQTRHVKRNVSCETVLGPQTTAPLEAVSTSIAALPAQQVITATVIQPTVTMASGH